MKRTISGLDHTLSAWLQERPKSLRYLYSWITLIGHPAVVMFIATTGIVFGFGLALPAISIGLMAAIVVYALSALLKLVLRRPRPTTPYAARYPKIPYTISEPKACPLGKLKEV